MTTPQTPATAFGPHNHGACANNVLKTAERLSQDAGLRLTPVRRRTLEILLTAHRAIGAYEVLEQLVASGFGKQPPVAYRALDFLVDNGLAHRIRRLNAYAACMQPGHEHASAFFICADCGSVAESAEHQLSSAIKALAKSIGFDVFRMNLEIMGQCPSCKPKA